MVYLESVENVITLELRIMFSGILSSSSDRAGNYLKQTT